ncbi:hypothetical protein ASG01_06550 [Chryseobacterium sp. Leaf180]|uniref:alpha-L-fucosidase n=1 Tax=Chryseobacterium sp. Leaf180 TaxID=1736289 RepID=UPI0006FDD29C|nr:alpha-L-fucosidase [Chryseobacterium sp. Leaf180]KQR95499.1 hypothetical protein ASG01_06550 [Chryseobacterium sp. Leaf180]
MKENIFGFYLFFVCSFFNAQKPPEPYGVLPTEAQLRWHEMEMYGIIHFGVDTYTDKEWGFGDENPRLINPKNFDAEQIVSAAKNGGLKGVIVVAKHHDGLCLWPTKTTEHNISKSPWKNGKGDMVKEYQLACEKLGMKLGIYCSPWDRNSALYGDKKYIGIFKDQLTELYTNYGDIFTVWFDGANGGDGFYGGANEVRKIDRSGYYEWDKIWQLTRNLQPNAVVFGDVGPDVRWVGNEEGHAGETSWATYTPEAAEAGKNPANGFTKYQLATEGTRNGKFWMPAECDVPMRPGWFYHESQNSQVKSPYELLDLYYKSVGRGASLDLGLSPNRDGQLNAEDVTSLARFGKIVKNLFSENLAKKAKFTAGNIRGNNEVKFGTGFLVDDDRYSYWATDDAEKNPELLLSFDKEIEFNVIRIRENIKLGQRIEKFYVEAFIGNKWQKIASATAIGPNRLLITSKIIRTKKVRLKIEESPVCLAISDFGLFLEPGHPAKPEMVRMGDEVLIKAEKNADLYFTQDGKIPDGKSQKYSKPIVLINGGMIRAIAIQKDQMSDVATQNFGLSKKKWKISAGKNSVLKNAEKMSDDKVNTFGTVVQKSGTDFLPQDLIIDLNEEKIISAIEYLPGKEEETDGVVDQYEISVSTDGKNWKTVAGGEFSNIASNRVPQNIKLKKPEKVRYILFKANKVLSGNFASFSEINVFTE